MGDLRGGNWAHSLPSYAVRIWCSLFVVNSPFKLLSTSHPHPCAYYTSTFPTSNVVQNPECNQAVERVCVCGREVHLFHLWNVRKVLAASIRNQVAKTYLTFDTVLWAIPTLDNFIDFRSNQSGVKALKFPFFLSISAKCDWSANVLK